MGKNSKHLGIGNFQHVLNTMFSPCPFDIIYYINMFSKEAMECE